MTVPLKTRVVIADDHTIVRRGLRALFEPEADFEVVAEAEDGREAVAQALEWEADLVVLDIAMPRMTGLDAARELGRRAPRTRAVMLSMHDNEEYFFAALRAGASG